MAPPWVLDCRAQQSCQSPIGGEGAQRPRWEAARSEGVPPSQSCSRQLMGPGPRAQQQRVRAHPSIIGGERRWRKLYPAEALTTPRRRLRHRLLRHHHHLHGGLRRGKWHAPSAAETAPIRLRQQLRRHLLRRRHHPHGWRRRRMEMEPKVQRAGDRADINCGARGSGHRTPAQTMRHAPHHILAVGRAEHLPRAEQRCNA